MDKPLKDWTLGEIKAACQDCETCEMHQKGADSTKKSCLVLQVICNGTDGNFFPPWMWKIEQQLTDSELAICRAVGAKWVTRDKWSDAVLLWRSRPLRMGEKDIFYGDPDGRHDLGRVNASLFRSVQPGDCVEVPDG